MDRATPAEEDWLKESKAGPTAYFLSQYEKPYRSTVALHRWLKSMGVFTSAARIVDVGCGMGAPLGYFAAQEPQCEFCGLDFNPTLIAEGSQRLQKLPNVRLEEADIRQLSRYGDRFDGVLSMQTLSWLEDYSEPLAQMAAMRPRWMALTSLFYDGPVNTRIQVQDYSKPVEGKPYKDAFYNVYSLPLFKQRLQALGFPDIVVQPFEIDCD